MFGAFSCCYGSTRAAESRLLGEPNQDFLAFSTDGDRFVFAVCDGVGSSFRGDIAAKLLGNALVQWLWTARTADEAALGWPSVLEALAVESQLVDQVDISPQIPDVLQEVLHEKQQIGSESMFAAGVLDRRSGQHLLTWAGDIRIGVTVGEEPSVFLGPDAFSSGNRWSSRHGIIGDVFMQRHDWKSPWRIFARTDGFSHDPPPDAALLTQWHEEASNRPDADDCSFLIVACW
ncbi:MAG: protein phosphatase 2C domain-containing protein [Thermomicrobiales bacterium]|nr:protein phosphatase 2C domain-containing protein [Thermomicrobiales bacterium]